MPRWKQRDDQRRRRHFRIRRKVQGSTERPRLVVYRSLNHIYAQVVDDTQGRTLAAASDAGASDDKIQGAKGKVERSKIVGGLVAERAKAAGVTRVAFDRGGYLYHGRVKALAEGAREGGLEF